MRGSSLLFVLVVPLWLFGSCHANQTNYARAAIGTGVMIGEVGLRRALTKDCWGRCRLGYLCNEENGLCELGECLPGCAVGTHCVRDLRGHTYCVSDVSQATAQSTPAVAPKPDAGPSIDAGVADAKFSGAAVEGSREGEASVGP